MFVETRKTSPLLKAVLLALPLATFTFLVTFFVLVGVTNANDDDGGGGTGGRITLEELVDSTIYFEYNSEGYTEDDGDNPFTLMYDSGIECSNSKLVETIQKFGGAKHDLRNPHRCHLHRKRDVRLGKWGNPDTYRPADRITDRLFVGSVCAATDIDWLVENNIGLVISVADEWPLAGSIQVKYANDTNGSSQRTIQFKYFAGLTDDETVDYKPIVLDQFYNVAKEIERFYDTHPTRSVLVYCNMGISRSVSATIFTLMYMSRNKPSTVFEFRPSQQQEDDYNLVVAFLRNLFLKEPVGLYFELVRMKRPAAFPNSLYTEILKTYAQSS